MHRVKKKTCSPRTLYNGPFVLPNQTPNGIINHAPLPGIMSGTFFPNGLGQLGRYAQRGHAPNSPATPRSQFGSRPLLYHNGMLGTPRSDEGCRPVYNFSFLDDSSRSHDISAHLNSPRFSSPSHATYMYNMGRLNYTPSPRVCHSPTSRKCTPFPFRGGSKIPYPGASKVPPSRDNIMSTPKTIRPPAPRINKLSSNNSPSSGIGASQDSKSSEFQHLQQFLSPGSHQTSISPQFIRNSSPIQITSRHNQSLSTFFPPPSQQYNYSKPIGGGSFIPTSCFPHNGVYYQYEPQVFKAIPNNFYRQAYQQNQCLEKCHPSHDAYKTQCFARNSSIQPEATQNTQPQVPNTDNLQTGSPVNLLGYQIKTGTNQSQDNFQLKNGEHAGIFQYPNSLWNLLHHENMNHQPTKNPQQGFDQYLQTISENPCHTEEDSSYTKQSSFISSIISSNQSHNSSNIVENDSRPTKMIENRQCDNAECTCQNAHAKEFHASLEKTLPGVFTKVIPETLRPPLHRNLHNAAMVNKFGTKIVPPLQDSCVRTQFHTMSSRPLPHDTGEMISRSQTFGEIVGSSLQGQGWNQDATNYKVERKPRHTYSPQHTKFYTIKDKDLHKSRTRKGQKHFASDAPKTTKSNGWPDFILKERKPNTKTWSNSRRGNQSAPPQQDLRASEHGLVSAPRRFKYDTARGASFSEMNRRYPPRWTQSHDKNRFHSHHCSKDERGKLQGEGHRHHIDSNPFSANLSPSQRNNGIGRYGESRHGQNVRHEYSRRFNRFGDRHNPNYPANTRRNKCQGESAFAGKNQWHQNQNLERRRGGYGSKYRQPMSRGQQTSDNHDHDQRASSEGPTSSEGSSCDHASASVILDKFAVELKRFPATRNNPIQTLHSCANACDLPIKIHCAIHPVAANNKEEGFDAVLFINGKPFAKRNGKSKRFVKHQVYEEALSILLHTTSAHDDSLSNGHGIQTDYNLSDGGKTVERSQESSEDSRQSGDDCVVQSKEKTTCRREEEGLGYGETGAVELRQAQPECAGIKPRLDQMTLCYLGRLIRDLRVFKDAGVEGESSKVSQIWIVDKHCVKNRLKLLAIYKGIYHPNEHMTITCDLYLCERFLAQGSGTNRKIAQMHAYRSACVVLKNMASSEDILSLQRLDSSEFKSSDVIDIVHKGYQVVEESNLCRMNRTKQPPVEHRNRDSLIILEHEDWSRDRKKHAHCILAQSATQCGCLLEWRSEPCGRGFRCTMTLQGEQVASCVTKLRKDAVRVASIVALFTFYETQPVVQGFHIDYPAVWTTREKLREMARAHLASAPSGATSDSAVADAEAQREQAQTDRCHQQTGEEDYRNQLEKGVASAIELLVDEFSSRKTLDVLVSAADWRSEEKRHLRGAAAGSGLRVVTENFQEDQILVVNHKYSLLEIYSILQKQPEGAEGRYKILRDEEKPCYMDVAAEIAADESVLGEVAPIYVPHPSKMDKIPATSSLRLKERIPVKSLPNVHDKTGKILANSKSLETGEEIKEVYTQKCLVEGADLQQLLAEYDPPSVKCDIAEEKESDEKVDCVSCDVDNENEKFIEEKSVADKFVEEKMHDKDHQWNTKTDAHIDLSPVSSNISDAFVTADNTLETGVNLPNKGGVIHFVSADIPTVPALGSLFLDRYSPNQKTQSPERFSRPRITSTPSSHKGKGSENTPQLNSHDTRVSESTTVNRLLAFPETDNVKDADEDTQGTRSVSAEHSLRLDDPGKENKSTGSLSATFSLSPSNPSSARLNDPLSTSDECQPSEGLCEDVQNTQDTPRDKSCQCGRSLEEHEDDHQGSDSQLLYRQDGDLAPSNQIFKRPQRPKMDGSIDVEACLGSPEQRAVCIFKHQSSMCVRFSSEFATCDETNGE